jgi:hypothetical protein
MRISMRFLALAVLVVLVSVTILSIWRNVTTVSVAPVAAATPTGSRPDSAATDEALQHFQQNVGAYLALRHRVAASLPLEAVASDAVTLQWTEKGLADGIRAARRDARRGDIFTADVAPRFRSLIGLTLQQHGISPADVLSDIKEELDEGRTSGQRPTVAINGRFAWGSGSAMPREILEALPELPDPLEYRFVNRDLLLADVDADLVVDILPDAVQRHGPR